MKKQMLFQKNRRLKSPHQGRGFTLIELLVAGTLGLVVILAASGAFLQTYKLNNVTAERVNIQSSVRDAIAKMTADANQAGSFGCANLAMNAANADPSKPLFISQTKPIAGFHNQFFNVNDSEKDAWGVNLNINNSDVYTTGGTVTSIDSTSRNIGAYGAAILDDTVANDKIKMYANKGTLKIYPNTDVLMFQYGEGGSVAYAGESGGNLSFKLNLAENPRLWSARLVNNVSTAFNLDGTRILASCGRIDAGNLYNTPSGGGASGDLDFSTGTLTIGKKYFSDGQYKIFTSAAGAKPSEGHLANQLQFLMLHAPIYFVGEYQVTSQALNASEPMTSNTPKVYKGLFRADLNGRYPLELLVPNATDLQAKFAFAKGCTANTKVTSTKQEYDVVFSKKVRDPSAEASIKNYAPMAVSVDLTVQGAIRGMDASGVETGGYRTSVYQNVMMAIQGGNVCANRIER